MSLTEIEKSIVKELIKNPKISDNKISKIIKIPLKTVNRKRKRLEEKGILNYFTMVDNGPYGTKEFGSMQLYIARFRYGINRKSFMDNIHRFNNQTYFFSKHIFASFLGERDGRLEMVLFLESRNESDIMEIFNVDVLNAISGIFGKDCIDHVESHNINIPLRILHNYLINPNKLNGIISKDWNDKEIFVN